jgi:predicted dehydrogenase
LTASPRVGVVGAGSLGFHHVRLLRDLPGARLAGFFDSSAERAAHVTKELGVTGAASYEALLAECDAVSIVVPTPAHHAVAKAAIEAGKHVFIEKPITVTLEQADDLIAAARKRGVLVQIGHIERFNRAVRAALPFVHEPRFVDSERLAPFSPRGADVAVVLDLMIHDIDLLLTLVGADAADISAVGVPVLTPMLDIANARVTFSSGAVANITASRISRDRKRKIRIFQHSGYMSLDLAAGTGEYYKLKGNLAEIIAAGKPLDMADVVERVALEAAEGEPLKLELESFVAALNGKAPVVVSGEDGRSALAVALKIVNEIERTLPALAGKRRSHA